MLVANLGMFAMNDSRVAVDGAQPSAALPIVVLDQNPLGRGEPCLPAQGFHVFAPRTQPGHQYSPVCGARHGTDAQVDQTRELPALDLCASASVADARRAGDPIGKSPQLGERQDIRGAVSGNFDDESRQVGEYAGGVVEESQGRFEAGVRFEKGGRRSQVECLHARQRSHRRKHTVVDRARGGVDREDPTLGSNDVQQTTETVGRHLAVIVDPANVANAPRREPVEVPQREPAADHAVHIPSPRSTDGPQYPPAHFLLLKRVRVDNLEPELSFKRDLVARIVIQVDEPWPVQRLAQNLLPYFGRNTLERRAQMSLLHDCRPRGSRIPSKAKVQKAARALLYRLPLP